MVDSQLGDWTLTSDGVREGSGLIGWDQIAAIDGFVEDVHHFKIPGLVALLSTRHNTLRLSTQDGRTFTTQVGNSEVDRETCSEFYEKIRSNIEGRLREQYLADLEEGSAVTFGEVVISRREILRPSAVPIDRVLGFFESLKLTSGTNTRWNCLFEYDDESLGGFVVEVPKITNRFLLESYLGQGVRANRDRAWEKVRPTIETGGVVDCQLFRLDNTGVTWKEFFAEQHIPKENLLPWTIFEFPNTTDVPSVVLCHYPAHKSGGFQDGLPSVDSDHVYFGNVNRLRHAIAAQAYVDNMGGRDPKGLRSPLPGMAERYRT